MRFPEIAALFAFALWSVLTPAIASAADGPDPFAGLAWDTSHAGEPLSLRGYRETFRDDFDKPSITGASGAGPWFSPVHAPFGAAAFQPPGSTPDPFSLSQGALSIRMEEVQGRWQSGLIQTVNDKGQGFLQQGGYFEMRAKFPPGHGSWPAFWLLSANEFYPERFTHPRIEIDIIEAYGKSDFDGHHATVHIKPGRIVPEGGLTKSHYKSHYTMLTTISAAKSRTPLFPSNANMFDGRFHTYGALLTDKAVTIYYDGLELARFPMVKEFQTPVYMLVDLALYPDEAKDAKSPMIMEIDYVRALAKSVK